MVDLPPPEGPTSAVTWPGSATKDRSRITGSPRPVVKRHLVEFDAAVLQFKVRLADLRRLGGRAVEHLEQDAHAHQPAAEVDVQPR